jgi:hypothetical protein
MAQLEDMFSIETPTFILVHKKSNISNDMKIENNSFQLPGFNLTNNKSQINETKLIMLKVNDLKYFCFFFHNPYN